MYVYSLLHKSVHIPGSSCSLLITVKLKAKYKSSFGRHLVALHYTRRLCTGLYITRCECRSHLTISHIHHIAISD